MSAGFFLSLDSLPVSFLANLRSLALDLTLGAVSLLRVGCSLGLLVSCVVSTRFGGVRWDANPFLLISCFVGLLESTEDVDDEVADDDEDDEDVDEGDVEDVGSVALVVMAFSVADALTGDLVSFRGDELIISDVVEKARSPERLLSGEVTPSSSFVSRAQEEQYSHIRFFVLGSNVKHSG